MLYCIYLVDVIEVIARYVAMHPATMLSGFLDPLWHNVVPWVGNAVSWCRRRGGTAAA